METGRGPAPTNPAEVYERFFVPAMFAPLASVLLERVQIRAGTCVLDIACGTGVVARTAAALIGDVGRIVGLDLSLAMLAVARSRAAAEGVSVEWWEGTADALPFLDDSFDLAVCQMGLQFFPDKAAALTEVRRVLSNGGEAVVAVWQGLDRHPFHDALNSSMQSRLGIPAIQLPFSMGDPEEIRALLTGAGFEDVRIEDVSITARFRESERFVPLQVSASAAAVPALQILTPEARAELAAAVKEDMAPLIQERIVGDSLEVPMHAHVARGLKR